ncbi:MAG: SLBB domain-containing protein [Deltaproteobacteria bacterium]|nr:SLBB domain-containing protein [Deltaproteobacteria bacterium]
MAACLLIPGPKEARAGSLSPYSQAAQVQGYRADAYPSAQPTPPTGTSSMQSIPGMQPAPFPAQKTGVPSSATTPSAPKTGYPFEAAPPALGTYQGNAGGSSIEPEIAPEEPITPFEAYVYSLTGLTEIKKFGYEFFNAPPSTFAPADNVPVTQDYLLGPGDEIKISIWGKLNSDFTGEIDREGMINIPELGMVRLSGLSFSEASAALQKELARYYRPSEVKMSVSMGRLRSVRVFVVGKARRPGSYTLSSLSTVINAVFSAGGPGRVGSMRDIQLKRKGMETLHIDLYEFLLKGDKVSDVRVMPEDVIYIPPSGPSAAIYGTVRVPAIYEIKEGATLKELIEMAGGLDETAFTGRVQVDRIIDNRREAVFESSLEDPKAMAMAVQSGDLVRVFQVVQDRHVARLMGAVQQEGEYGIGKSLTIKELIDLAGGLKTYAYTKEAELTRVTPTQSGPETVKITIDLQKAMDGDTASNIQIRENDFLLVRAIPEWDLYKTVNVAGEVRFPGVYTIKKGETISSLIGRAGGFTDKAYLKGAVFTRESVREIQQTQLDESIRRLEMEMLSQSAQSIEAALNPAEAAQQQAATEQKKALIAKMKAAKAKGRVSVSLSALDKFKGSPSDLALEDGDELQIPEVPSEVQVVGSVYNQTAFVYSRRLGVSDYLKKAGGLTKNADEDELYVLKVDGTAVSRREASSWGFHWDTEANRWVGGGFMSSGLDPGDTIVVPEKIEKVAWLREFKDMTQILYQIAVTAGVLIVAF